MKYLIALGLIGLGFVLVIYAKWIRDNAGIRFDFAENIFGGGGTITMMKLMGVFAIIAAFVVAFNF
jgi:hypothetical protein